MMDCVCGRLGGEPMVELAILIAVGVVFVGTALYGLFAKPLPPKPWYSNLPWEDQKRVEEELKR
jgi:hypothetical protein